MSEIFEGVAMFPHLIILAVQLISFGLFIKDDFQDRLIIGLAFLVVIVIGFISGSFSIDVIVLFALGAALLVRGTVSGKSSMMYFGAILLMIQIVAVGSIIYNLDIV